MSERTRLPQLDVLRGVAIVLVLFRHDLDWRFAGHLRLVAEALERFGKTGVDLFFVLSGFLIGGLLLDEARGTGRLDVKRFLVRRAFKLWPGYVALLVVAIVVYTFEAHVGLAAALYEFRANFLHLQNYIRSPQIHTWSLAIEEHFYLALPLVIAPLVARGRIAMLPYLLVGCCLLCLGLRIYDASEPFDMYYWFATQFRIDALAFGVLLAYLARYHRNAIERVARHRLLPLVAAVLLSPPLLLGEDSALLRSVGLTYVYLGCGLVVLRVVFATGERWVTSRPARALAWVGIYSYSIYLWQLVASNDPVQRFILPLFELRRTSTWLIYTAIFFAFAIIAGVLLAKAIERPALAARERWFPATSRR